MERNKFRKEEVVSYLEEILKDGTATEEQEDLYIQFQWTGNLVKNYTYKRTISQMIRYYEI
jgi:hypothetical protein